jgi:hypothetical protein
MNEYAQNGYRQNANGGNTEIDFCKMFGNDPEKYLRFFEQFNISIDIDTDTDTDYPHIYIHQHTKTDISIDNIKFQIKGNIIKEEKKQYNQCHQCHQGHQIDKQPLIPWLRKMELESCYDLLKPFIEIPIDVRTKRIESGKYAKLLNLENYSIDELELIKDAFNHKKIKIIENVLYGAITNEKPDFLCCINYKICKNDTHSYRIPINMYIVSMIDVINFLSSFDFRITNDGKCITLNNIMSVRRKGGDSGKKTSNQIQTIMDITKLFVCIKKTNINIFYCSL